MAEPAEDGLWDAVATLRFGEVPGFATVKYRRDLITRTRDNMSEIKTLLAR